MCSVLFKYTKGNEQEFSCLFSLRDKSNNRTSSEHWAGYNTRPFSFLLSHLRWLQDNERIPYDALLFVVYRVVIVKKKIRIAGICCSRMIFSDPLLCIPRQKIMRLGVPHVGESIHSISPLKHSCCPHSRSCSWKGTTWSITEEIKLHLCVDIRCL